MGVTVGGKQAAHRVKSTGIIHTRSAAASCDTFEGNTSCSLELLHYNISQCQSKVLTCFDHTCCRHTNTIIKLLTKTSFCSMLRKNRHFSLPCYRWLATKRHPLSNVWNGCFLSKMYRFVSLGCFGNERPKPCQHSGNKKSLLFSAEKWGEKRFFFLRFSHWVTQFHAPLAYLGWRAMKSVQFWDFRGTVFWNLLRYVAILLSPPLDRLHYYVTVAKVKL